MDEVLGIQPHDSVRVDTAELGHMITYPELGQRNPQRSVWRDRIDIALSVLRFNFLFLEESNRLSP